MYKSILIICEQKSEIMYDIAIISGDGIGQEVMESAEYLLDKLDINFNFKYGEAGFECFNKNGTTLPEETIKIAKSSDATLFGASTSTPGQPSPIINLRKELNVYANLRPIRSYKGINSIAENIDFIIVRENTEGLYSQKEYGDENKVIAERVITRKASEKICEIAYCEGENFLLNLLRLFVKLKISKNFIYVDIL